MANCFSIGRVDVRIDVSGATFELEADFEVRFVLAHSKPCRNCKHIFSKPNIENKSDKNSDNNSDNNSDRQTDRQTDQGKVVAAHEAECVAVACVCFVFLPEFHP